MGHVLSFRVDARDYLNAAEVITRWASSRLSKAVFVASVNNVMAARDSSYFRELSSKADMVTPDGMPLVWALRLLGMPQATRVYGPDLTVHLLEKAQTLGLTVGFYGSSRSTLTRLTEEVKKRWPRLQIVYSTSPPYRPLSPEEAQSVEEEIRATAPHILFVGLGCPKQEEWIIAHRGRLPCVMLGVGAAFDFIAGTKPQAPRWMMPLGLEWLFRLCTEPRRLWRRYLLQNPRFVVLFAGQLIRHHFNRLRSRPSHP